MNIEALYLRTQRSISVIIVFSLLSSCAGVSSRSDTADPFDLGLGLFRQGKYEEAIPFFQKSIENDADRAKAYLYMGRSYLNLNMWLKAVPPLRTAVTLSTGEMKQEVFNVLLDALMGAALFEFEKGDFDSAISRLKEVLDLKPEFIKARDELVKTLFAFGDKLISEGLIEEAISKYRDILKLAPEMFRAQKELIGLLFKFAEKLLSEGQLENAIKQYGEIIELAPDDLNAYTGLARAFFESGDYLKAMEAVKDALQKDPFNSDALSLFRKLLTQ